MSKKVLVAGASGYLGRFVVKEFKERGYWVRALVRERSVKKLSQEGEYLQPAVDKYIDDIFIGEAVNAETLKGLCDGIDIVFSSLGITRQRDRVSFADVDYGANRNILDEALRAGSVKKFIFISVLNEELFIDLDIGKARGQFVKELLNSKIDATIIQPTGFFSDMTEFLQMAQRGKIYLIGDGQNKGNPIFGGDLAKVCVDAVNSKEERIPVGGPQILSHRQMAEIAFKVLGKKPKISYLPPKLLLFFAKIVKIFSRHYYSLMMFFIRAFQNDFVAPQYGTVTLEDYYKRYLSKRQQK